MLNLYWYFAFFFLKKFVKFEVHVYLIKLEIQIGIPKKEPPRLAGVNNLANNSVFKKDQNFALDRTKTT